MKIVIISGASSGIGFKTMEILAGNGCTVIGLARGFDAELTQAASHIYTLKCDITDSAQISFCIDQVIKQFGQIDILINCAGSGILGTVEDITINELQQELSINLTGHVDLCRQIIPIMRNQGSGHIINILAAGAQCGFPGLPYYFAAKTALESISYSLYWELEAFGVKVSKIEVGPVKSKFGKHMVRKNSKDYQLFLEKVQNSYKDMFRDATLVDDVANLILKCTKEQRFSYRTSTQLAFLQALKNTLPFKIYSSIIKFKFKLWLQQEK